MHSDPIFGEIIHSYTPEQAVEDGVLVDATQGDLAEVTRQHFGNTPVYMTCGVFALIEQAVNSPRHGNDWKGVWHDILWMSQAIRRREEALFTVIITGTGRRRNHTLRAVRGVNGAGQMIITYLLPHED